MAYKILIVEDEATLQTALSEWLSEEGFKVVSATTGEEALQKVSEDQPDLVLLDLILPKANGLEALKKLKAGAETSGIPVIVLTNLGEEYNRKRALEAGAEDYLVKAEHDLASMSKVISKHLKTKKHGV